MTTSLDVMGLRKRLHAELTAYLDRPHRTALHRAAARKQLVDMFKATRRGAKDAWALLDDLADKGVMTASDLKGALRDQLSPLQSNRCCFCRRWLANNGYARQIEHILPRKHFPQFSAHFWNLAIVCIDCNSLKKAKIWGSIDTKRRRYPLPASVKTWFHPRFHSYDEHVRFVRIEANGLAVVVFVGKTEQGRFLCKELLRHIAMKEMLVASNPVLSACASSIDDYQQLAGADKGAGLRAFQEALAQSIVRLVHKP